VGRFSLVFRFLSGGARKYLILQYILGAAALLAYSPPKKSQIDTFLVRKKFNLAMMWRFWHSEFDTTHYEARCP
jgi:hypothetical protein